MSLAHTRIWMAGDPEPYAASVEAYDKIAHAIRHERAVVIVEDHVGQPMAFQTDYIVAFKHWTEDGSVADKEWMDALAEWSDAHRPDPDKEPWQR